ncbi:serine-rich adhesin for platelets isoform X2 [Anopheles maculipalpis]|uniref:serine-rich adhesin for platelets isoform X2 n=1 Tax=Anopheles maculipalpis TaxID=1496333 RepID=UPI0021593A0E|nr:serine-rich adhesin for platelets isoform X2 [Anopheles maculipalpis]
MIQIDRAPTIVLRYRTLIRGSINDISRDGLSQSHDSVFSESAGTASSLSITLKNELADVLRKRRKDRQGEVSDEDLGLPLSPITPQRKDRGMNKSEGSLSILSMTSSDMDDDRSASNASGHNLLHLDSSTSGSISMNRSDNMDESGDSSKLSHSAAKHKLAVRPKKKGPTRARTRPRESTLLPATPEVNEESLKLSSTNIASNFSPAKEANEKAHSLPYGIMPPGTSTPLSSHPMPRSPSKEISTSKLSIGDVPVTSSSIYVNRNISKSHEFERTSEHHLTVEGTSTVSSRKEDDGFFKRILNYSFKKKKHESSKEESSSVTASPRKEDNTSSVYISSAEPAISDCIPTEQIMKLSLVVGEPEMGELSGYKKIKSGPAARQRVFPKDIFTAEEREANAREQQQHTQRYSSNVEVNRQSVASSGSGHSLTIGEGKVPLHKSEEYLVSKTRKFSERSVDGGEGDDEESDGRKYVSHGERLKSPKVYGLSSYQQKLAKISISSQPAAEANKESPSKRAKSVEKSKSFRTYTDSVSNQLQAGGHQVPSLPNLSSSLSVGNFSNNFLETEHKFFSMTENMNTGKQRVFKDYISNADDDGDSRLLSSSASLQKFEINDNNLLNPREEYVDHQPKSIVLTTNTLTPPEPTSILNKSNQNISQIEENIDKLVSSQFVSIIKSSDEGSSNERLDEICSTGQISANVPEFMKIQLNRVDGTGRPTKTSSIVLTTSPTPAPPTSPAIASPTASAGQYQPPDDAIKLQRRFSNENIEITESKPPLPPSVVARSSLVLEGGGIPKSPPAFRKQGSGVGNGGATGDLAGTKRNSMNLSQDLSDDRKVILQRRTSVTEEKIKYERRISSSSEDIKFEKKKSTSEELLEKRGSAGSGTGNSNYNSGSSSGDELVVLRKKFVVGEKEGKDKDGTPELMKVFARRSLKLRSDDDYKVTDSGKPLSSIDSDKENQSSEEKLDKVGLQQTKQSQQQQHQQQQQPELISTSLVQAVSVTPLQAPATNGSLKNGCTLTDGVPLKNGSNENGQTPASGEAILRKSVTSKPFGVPNRFGNSPNGAQPRNATSFVEVRKTLLPSATVTVSPVNNNFVKSTNPTIPAGQETGCENPSTVSNNNTINTNRHTIASLNQLNSTNGVGGGVGAINNNASNATIIETDGGGNDEINEFKGILQRRAEWEKRAKEGFK